MRDDPRIMSAIETYITEIQNNLRAGNATEHTHRAALQQLLQSIRAGLQVTNEPNRRVDCGAPDMVVMERKGHLPIGHVEAKDIGVSLGDTHKSEQLQRYRKYLPNLILTDYVNFRWYYEGELRSEASLGSVDAAKGRLRTTPPQQEQVLAMLSGFADCTPAPIRKAKALAERLARLTHMTRDIVVRAFERRTATQTLRDLREVLAHALVPDLLKDEKTGEFADLYAQTLTYGLFAARCQHESDGDSFSVHEAAREIPKTNPLLRQLFNAITGPDFEDEPYAGFVHELVAVLSHADIKAVLEDFGRAGVRQDPVLHFYETFLATYDPKLRESRGVYYTPEPVVGYIVRSVDHLLRTRFKIKEGLADSEKVQRTEGMPPVHRTLILDPAAGTGTFLYEVVREIREQFLKRKRAGFWSQYVHEHLLPRLFGFELLMAPYAMAHLKLGMQLAGQDLPEDQQELTRYGFDTDDRLQVYLTNTLDQIEREVQHFFGPLQKALGEESRQAARVKRDLPILVVLGNPPYSGISSNQGDWIDGLLKGTNADAIGPDRKPVSYYHVDGEPLGERKLWLQDDYVKFIRWAQWRLEQTGQGILAFITNHGYLDNPTFRGMRWSLMEAFDEIFVLDLHGNTKKKEIAPDGGADQNVFDIQQGVAIGIFVKHGGKKSRPATVHHADLWGKRDEKYRWLEEQTVESTKWERIKPEDPFYLFKPMDQSEVGDYYDWPQIGDVMGVNVTGIVTARDAFVIDFDEAALLDRIYDLRNERLSDEAIRQKYFQGKGSSKYPPGDSRGWKLPKARERLREDAEWDQRVAPILYRPFDERSIYYVPWMVDWPRTEAMPHLLAGKNLGLIYMRQVAMGDSYTHFGVTRRVVDNRAFYSNKGIMSFSPLYLYPGVGKVSDTVFEQWPAGKDGRRPNLDPGFVSEIERETGLSFVSDGRGNLKKTFGPEDVLAYIYAVFHWPEYRRRYAPMLKMDFPRVPPVEDRERFVAFCAQGHALLGAHLLEDEAITGDTVGYPARGENEVEKGFPKYVEAGGKGVKAGKVVLASGDAGRVYINAEQYFEGVEPEVWAFQIGGYQVCEKWLKDRRGRTLSMDDLTHYTKVVESLRKTIAVMAEIERIGAE